MDNSELCIPPNPDVSGWWWLKLSYGEYAYYWDHDCHQWLFSEGLRYAEQVAAQGYHVIGPVTPFSEVEAMRAEIARMSHPDLVTVRRSDLFAMLENAIPHALTAWLQGKIDKMEKDAK